MRVASNSQLNYEETTMAFLTKRGKYYSINWRTSVDGKVKSTRKALGTRHKDVAEKMLKELEKL